MTGFAQRLVARSAGQSTGLPLLKPRPASRFETSEPLVLDEVTETIRPAQETRIAGPASDPVHSLARGQAQGPANQSPPAEMPDHEKPAPAQRPQSDLPLARNRAVPSEQSLPVATPQSLERADVETPHPVRETSVPANIARVVERPAVLADQTKAPPLTPSMATDHAKVDQPAAPQISIGRIDVQFLAAEKPVAAPRPEPQRTRGFDAYARARRGMPR